MGDWDAKRGCFDWQQSVNQSGGAFSHALVSYLDCSHSNPSSQQFVHSLSLQKSGFLPNLKILKVVDILRSQAWLVKPANHGGFSVVSVERKRGHHNINFKFKRQLLRAVIVYSSEDTAILWLYKLSWADTAWMFIKWPLLAFIQQPFFLITCDDCLFWHSSQPNC